jgi:hypothetical protein
MKHNIFWKCSVTTAQEGTEETTVVSDRNALEHSKKRKFRPARSRDPNDPDTERSEEARGEIKRQHSSLISNYFQKSSRKPEEPPQRKEDSNLSKFNQKWMKFKII